MFSVLPTEALLQIIERLGQATLFDLAAACRGTSVYNPNDGASTIDVERRQAAAWRQTTQSMGKAIGLAVQISSLEVRT